MEKESVHDALVRCMNQAVENIRLAGISEATTSHVDILNSWNVEFHKLCNAENLP